MPVLHPRSRPPGRLRRTRRRPALLAGIGLLLATAVALPSSSTASVAGVAVPIQFNLTDNQGAWFDTGVNLFGTRSLSVAELPRLNLAGLPVDTNELLNTGTALLQGALAPPAKDPGDATPVPAAKTIGALGGAADLLNLDQLRAATSAAGKAGGASSGERSQTSEAIDGLEGLLAGKDPGLPIPLNSLPVGVDLMRQVADLQKLSPTDLSLMPTANFTVAAPMAASAHSVTSLIWPDGATRLDQSSAFVGDASMKLTEPGLYAWACKIHPYMLGATVVDDPLTPGLDFGRKLHVNARGGDLVVPSSADVIQQLVQKFFRITSPGNWQHYSTTKPVRWDPSYPIAPILMYDGAGQPLLVPSLDQYYQEKFHEGVTLPALDDSLKPKIPGVGELWVDTQLEKTAGKVKSGTATKVDVQNWTVSRKVALPQINLNNPHNMWADRSGELIYQTEWFSDRLTVFKRKTGELVRTIKVGPDPSHVMTRPDTDQLHVAINGGNAVVELSPGAKSIDRRILVQEPGEKPAHPHAHWMTADSKTMVTPNVNNNDMTIVNIPDGTIRKGQTEDLPIATSITPDASKAYVANFLGQSVSCVSLKVASCASDNGPTMNKTIDLWAGYDPVSGSKRGDMGGLPIQIPTSPDGNYALVANTLTGNIGVLDTKTDKVIKYLPCDSGCHGINFGAKKGGGYYAYVASKFSNALSIVDGDPNGDGNPKDAAVVGKMSLSSAPGTAMDDTMVAYDGLGGQGVLPYPIAYDGWVQNAPTEYAEQLTCKQLNPVKLENCDS